MGLEGWFGRNKNGAEVPQDNEARYRLIETDSELSGDINQLRMAVRSSDMHPEQVMITRVATKLGLSAEEVVPFVKTLDESDS